MSRIFLENYLQIKEMYFTSHISGLNCTRLDSMQKKKKNLTNANSNERIEVKKYLIEVR